MEITDIKIRRLLDTSKMRAIVSVTFDNSLVVHDIKIIESGSKIFLAMPSRQLQDGTFVDIAHPTNTSLRANIESRVIEEYKRIRNT